MLSRLRHATNPTQSVASGASFPPRTVSLSLVTACEGREVFLSASDAVLLMRCWLVSSLLTIKLVTTWLMRLASWWFWSTVHRPSSVRRDTRPIWPSLVWLTGLRVLVLRKQRLDTDAIWIPGCGRANARRHERARPCSFLCL